MKNVYAFVAALIPLSGMLYAGEADVVTVDVTPAGKDLYRFDVTVKHADAGWDHFADKWEILSPGGKILTTRILRHPHVHEQPFTRSLPAVEIPPGTGRVAVRAHCSVHEYGGKEVTVEIPGKSKEKGAGGKAEEAKGE